MLSPPDWVRGALFDVLLPGGVANPSPGLRCAVAAVAGSGEAGAGANILTWGCEKKQRKGSRRQVAWPRPELGRLAFRQISKTFLNLRELR